jgi:hypothetical protein
VRLEGAEGRRRFEGGQQHDEAARRQGQVMAEGSKKNLC